MGERLPPMCSQAMATAILPSTSPAVARCAYEVEDPGTSGRSHTSAKNKKSMAEGVTKTMEAY